MVVKMKLEEVWSSPSSFFQLLGNGETVLVTTNGGAMLINGQKVQCSMLNKYYIAVSMDNGTTITLTHGDLTMMKN